MYGPLNVKLRTILRHQHPRLGSFFMSSFLFKCLYYFVCKVKVKVTLVQALRLCTGRTAHRGNRGIALLFHDHDTKRG